MFFDLELGVCEAKGAVAKKTSDRLEARVRLVKHILGCLSVEDNDDKGGKLVRHVDFHSSVGSSWVLFFSIQELLLIFFFESIIF